MKNLLLILLMLIVFTGAYGQRKSKVDQKELKIDSLTKANASLTKQLDSVSNELKVYLGVYTSIIEKVIHYNFDPAMTGFIIDSLKASRDSAFAKLTMAPEPDLTADSLKKVQNENLILLTRIDSLRNAEEAYWTSTSAEDLEKSKAIVNLKQLKELLDAKIISESEYITVKKKYLEKL